MQQSETKDRIATGNEWAAPYPLRPFLFDLPYSLRNHRIVLAMRAAMERHAGAQCRCLAGGQQQAIAAKIVESHLPPAKVIEHLREASRGQQLLRQQVMALHFGLITGLAPHVYRAERELRSSHDDARHLCPPGKVV
ncbi:hypothetical protein GCM10023208_09730 [Erythrobacter westpacificensis]|uniref:Uncharacterized protein n=1 Tax=Erythrobacter westpacificensis TaxID=1055231 RepID=A0ABP9K6Y2_9SPHN